MMFSEPKGRVMPSRAGILAVLALILLSASAASWAADPSENLGTIAGDVTDVTTGRGIPNMVVATANGQKVVTDKNGAYTLRVPPGVQTVYLQSDAPAGYMLPPTTNQQGKPSTVVNVTAGQSAAVSFALLPDARTDAPIEGRVVDPQGKPVSGATILCRPTIVMGQNVIRNGTQVTTYSDADGNFRLKVPPGTLLRARFNDLATEAPVQAGAPGEIVTLQLSTHGIYSLTVKVADPKGALIPLAQVSLSGMAAIGAPQVIAPGVFKFDGLTSDTPVSLIAAAPDFGQMQFPVEVPPADAPKHVDMTATLQPADQLISGVVVDQDGNPAPNIGLLIATFNQSAALTDAQGRFEFHVAKDTRVLVQLLLDPPNQAYMQIVAPRTDVRFYLPPGISAAAHADRPDSRTAAILQSLQNLRAAQMNQPPPATRPAR